MRGWGSRANRFERNAHQAAGRRPRAADNSISLAVPCYPSHSEDVTQRPIGRRSLSYIRVVVP